MADLIGLGFFMQGRVRAAAAFAALFGLAGMANAANVTSVNPTSIVQALQNNGYKAVLSKTDDGDPMIQTSSDGNTIVIVMTDCENHKSCTTTEFVGVWDCSDSVEKCRQVALASNAAESPVHVLMSADGKTATTYSYLLYDDVGISEALFVKNLQTFNHYHIQFSADVAKK